MKTILNLTQHNSTPAQTADGLVDLTPEQAVVVRAMLTFTEIPKMPEVDRRAEALAAFAERLIAERFAASGEQIQTVMIGGAPYLMGPLERRLARRDIDAVYSFSERRSVDIQQPDGSVRKVAEFAHIGWVPAVEF